MTIRAVILDMGGVLFTDGTKTLMSRLCASGIPPAEVREVFLGDDSWRLRRGHLSASAFWAAKQSTFEWCKGRDLENEWNAAFTMREPLLNLVKAVQSNVTLGIVSGNIRDRVAYLEAEYDFLSYFDFKVFSFDVGFTKIDASIYDICRCHVEARGIDPAETLIIDDNDDCLSICKSSGFSTLKYDEFDHSQLEQCLNSTGGSAYAAHMPIKSTAE